MALVLGLSQCKKNEVKPDANNGMQITLSAAYGGEKTQFDNGTFTWNAGGTEYIYVGCEGQTGCIGTLTATGNGGNELVFSGTLTTTPEDGAKVYFFYLGNGAHADATEVNFADQTSGNVTDFHIAVGSTTYTTGSTDFAATLLPIMSIAKFDLSAFGGENVYVYGDDVYASARINYNRGTITKFGRGYINIGTGSAEKYVALIPSTDRETTVKFASNSHDGSKLFGNGIQSAKFYALGNNGALAIPATTVSIAENGTVPGLFSVDSLSAGTSRIITKMVRFSQGNLQYKPSDCSWQFAANQYDTIGADNANISPSYDGWLDLFGWGTWGEGKDPLNVSTSSSQWQWSTDFQGTLNGHNDWRTLRYKEWQYILDHSTYGVATVNGIHGIVILPDGSSLTVDTTHDNWGDNTYTAEVWAADMESQGAVFLPAAGSRDIHNGDWNVIRVGVNGSYWSRDSSSGNPRLLFFAGTEAYMTSLPPFDGRSVRLVR